MLLLTGCAYYKSRHEAENACSTRKTNENRRQIDHPEEWRIPAVLIDDEDTNQFIVKEAGKVVMRCRY